MGKEVIIKAKLEALRFIEKIDEYILAYDIQEKENIFWAETHNSKYVSTPYLPLESGSVIRSSLDLWRYLAFMRKNFHKWSIFLVFIVKWYYI